MNSSSVFLIQCFHLCHFAIFFLSDWLPSFADLAFSFLILFLCTLSFLILWYTFFLLNWHFFLPTSVYQYSQFFFYLDWDFFPCSSTVSEKLPMSYSCGVHFRADLAKHLLPLKYKEGRLCALFFTSQPCRANNKHQEMFLTHSLVGSDFALPTGGGVNTCICRAVKCGACLPWLLPHSKRQTLPAV